MLRPRKPVSGACWPNSTPTHASTPHGPPTSKSVSLDQADDGRQHTKACSKRAASRSRCSVTAPESTQRRSTSNRRAGTGCSVSCRAHCRPRLHRRRRRAAKLRSTTMVAGTPINTVSLSTGPTMRSRAGGGSRRSRAWAPSPLRRASRCAARFARTLCAQSVWPRGKNTALATVLSASTKRPRPSQTFTPPPFVDATHPRSTSRADPDARPAAGATGWS